AGACVDVSNAGTYDPLERSFKPGQAGLKRANGSQNQTRARNPAGGDIPNSADLGRDRVLQRALEHWQPAYMGWWFDMGPTGSQAYDVYLRTAISVDPEGWGNFGYVKMP